MIRFKNSLRQISILERSALIEQARHRKLSHDIYIKTSGKCYNQMDYSYKFPIIPITLALANSTCLAMSENT